MTKEELKKWEFLVRKYPDLAGPAYEIYVRHKTKDANLVTYFMWAAKTERRKEKRYRNGLEKYCGCKITTMEYENGNENNKLFL